MNGLPAVETPFGYGNQLWPRKGARRCEPRSDEEHRLPDAQRSFMAIGDGGLL